MASFLLRSSFFRTTSSTVASSKAPADYRPAPGRTTELNRPISALSLFLSIFLSLFFFLFFWGAGAWAGADGGRARGASQKSYNHILPRDHAQVCYFLRIKIKAKFQPWEKCEKAFTIWFTLMILNPTATCFRIPHCSKSQSFPILTWLPFPLLGALRSNSNSFSKSLTSHYNGIKCHCIWNPSSAKFVNIQKHPMTSHFKYMSLYIFVRGIFSSFLNLHDLQSIRR